jgi:hypothetical protein
MCSADNTIMQKSAELMEMYRCPQTRDNLYVENPANTPTNSNAVLVKSGTDEHQYSLLPSGDYNDITNAIPSHDLSGVPGRGFSRRASGRKMPAVRLLT